MSHPSIIPDEHLTEEVANAAFDRFASQIPNTNIDLLRAAFGDLVAAIRRPYASAITLSKIANDIQRVESTVMIENIKTHYALDLRAVKASYKAKLKYIQITINTTIQAHQNEAQTATLKHQNECHKLRKQIDDTEDDYKREVCALWEHIDYSKDKYDEDLNKVHTELREARQKHSIDISFLKEQLARATGSSAPSLRGMADLDEYEMTEGLTALDNAVNSAVVSYLFGDDNDRNNHHQLNRSVLEINEMIDSLDTLCKPSPKLLD
ncbi:hypothetical protein Q9L58_006508 [Maublancomyces gigas]|uniref:Uncharacterized protein n=1 Tax=Discina gigas TaxID=1032678 RepID=A0ABR3GF42_9PEZI